MPPWLGSIFKDPEKRAVISWLGGGGVVVAAGIWTVVTYVVEHKDASDKKGGTNITVSGQGIASGGNTSIGGNVNIGPSKEQIEQIQKPTTEQLAVKDAQIAALNAQNAALTKMLLEKNPAVGPGAQQAVSGAVQSIARGAAEGDPRSQQALDLLKANKIAEATQRLSAFAEDKTAHAEQAIALAEKDRKEAAIAYRNLAAIAGLADPKRALKAYEKALALDPDDVESLFWVGWIEIDYGDLNNAQTRLERVLKLAETGDHTSDKYWALIGLGDIKQQRGDLAGALKSYQDGLAIADRLAKSDPSNALWQRRLSVSYEKIGGMQQTQGDLAGALKSYQDSLAIIDRLAKADLGNAGWQRDLSVLNERLGDIFIAQGNLPAALEQYRASLDRMVPIRDRDPSNADLQRFTSAHQDRRRACGAGRPCRGAEILFRQPRHFRPPREIRPRQRGPAI
jgi:tetratricopeptide (TPR) repeat protein